MLRGKEPGPGERGPWGGQGGEGARGGCPGRAVTVPGSCLIIPFSIWALSVLGGDSECFLFLEGCVGSLKGQRCVPWGAGSPEPLPPRSAQPPSPPCFCRICPARGTPPAGSPLSPRPRPPQSSSSLCAASFGSVPRPTPQLWKPGGRSPTGPARVSLSHGKGPGTRRAQNRGGEEAVLPCAVTPCHPKGNLCRAPHRPQRQEGALLGTGLKCGGLHSTPSPAGQKVLAAESFLELNLS